MLTQRLAHTQSGDYSLFFKLGVYSGKTHISHLSLYSLVVPADRFILIVLM